MLPIYLEEGLGVIGMGNAGGDGLKGPPFPHQNLIILLIILLVGERCRWVSYLQLLVGWRTTNT